MKQNRSFERELQAGTENPSLVVDEEKCVIRNAAVITAGVPCSGHVVDATPDERGRPKDATPLWTDEETVAGVQRACEARPKGRVPVRLDHGSGFKDQVGYIDNFSMSEGKLRGDLVLLQKHEKTPSVLEMAVKMPECFGLSVSFREHPPVKSAGGDKAFVRCKEAMYVDIVSRPAANPDGMLSEGGAGGVVRAVESRGRTESGEPIRHFTTMADENTQTGTETEEELRARIAELEGANEQLEADLAEEREAGEELAKELEGGSDDDDGSDDDGADDDGADDDDGDGAGDGSVEAAVAEMAALLPVLKRELSWVRSFREEVQRELAEAEAEEEERNLAEVSGTIETLNEERERLLAENEALRNLATGTGTATAAVILDHSRALEIGSDNAFLARKRELMEKDGLSAAVAITKARAEQPAAFREFLKTR